MAFWISIALITLMLLVWVLWPLLRNQNSGGERRASYDMQVFKDQLLEVNKDVTKGVLSEAEAQRSRAEVSRRLLAAADAEQAESATADAPRWLSQAASIVIVGIIAGGGLLMYNQYGAPGARDFPLVDNIALQAQMRATQEARNANRPSQIEAEDTAEQRRQAMQTGQLPSINPATTEQNELVDQLITALETRPDDLIGHRMLVSSLASMQRFTEARHAQDKVMEILADAVTPDDLIAHAEIMIYAADGYVSPTAFVALAQALEQDASNPRIRYFAGYAANQYGYPEQAYRLWAGLLEEGPEDSPWIPSIRAQIGAVAEAAGITRPVTLNGPSADDIAAAGDMTAEERDDMIRNMVAGLASRLANEGGPASEWARLIGAYGVLGETEHAAEIWAEAQQVFAEDEGLASIRAAAISAGVASE